jgi:hypothetical protein
MTSAPQLGLVEGPRKAKGRTPSLTKLLKKDANFARKNVLANEKKKLGDGQCEVFESVQAAHAVRPPPPPPITVAYPPEDERPGRVNAPYAWFREDSPRRPRKPLVEVLSPARNPSGMKVTEIKPDLRAIERQHALNEQYAARGRRQMDSSAFSLAHPDPQEDRPRNKENR